MRDRAQRRDNDQPRAASRDQRHPLDLAADAAEISRRAELSRQKERTDGRLGHAFAEHVDASDEQLRQRARTGINARGHNEGYPPEYATRWQSDAACVVTADKLWRQPQAQQERRTIEAKLRAGEPVQPVFGVRARLSQVLGPGWRDDVYGRSRAAQGRQIERWSDESQAVARWRWPEARILEARNIEFARPLPFEPGSSREVQTALLSPDGDWQLASRRRRSSEAMTVHASGGIAAANSLSAPEHPGAIGAGLQRGPGGQPQQDRVDEDRDGELDASHDADNGCGDDSERGEHDDPFLALLDFLSMLT